MARSHSIRRLMVIAVAAMMLLGSVAVAPASAAETFTIKTLEAPTHIMNDHTPFGVRFSVDAAGGLQPNTSYYVKLRLSPNTIPSSSANRGFTWNPDTGEWVMERESIGGSRWFGRPVVETDATGAIGNAWVYGKFGDEAESGDYYLLVSLSETGDESSYNPVDPPAITVLNAQTNGSWVHNGLQGAAGADKRVAVRGSDSTGDENPATLYYLWQTEANLVDDDGNGTIDDPAEDAGPAGMTGDYRAAVSVATIVDIYTNHVLRADDHTTGAADCDMAVGVSDTVAPTAATDVTATVAPGTIDITWTAATDAGGSGLAGYRIYRSPVIVEGGLLGMATNPPVLVGATSGTSYSDTTASGGVEYEYVVRAVDHDTNIGPRSDGIIVEAIGANGLTRDDGLDRYLTAIDISKSNFEPDSTDTVVLATGSAFADALAGSSLAGVHGSPLLLVGSTLTGELKTEIERLGADNVVLLGGTAAISTDVETALKNAGYTVDRIPGRDRYETAANVARKVADLAGDPGSAYFVRADDFADAIAVSPFAYSNKTPVLLVSTNAVPDYTRAAITDLGLDAGMIAGGTSAVSANTQDTLETLLGSKPVRWDGADRYATAAEVAEAHVDGGMATYNYIGVATGLNFPDALGGGAAAGSNGGVLLLTPTTTLAPQVRTMIQANEALIDEVHVFGGVSAVSKAVYDEIAQTLQ